jgi:NUDIX domain
MKKFMYQYPRPALTVDCVVFGFDEGDLKVLLIERALAPFKGKWALPGGFVGMDETLDEAANCRMKPGSKSFTSSSSIPLATLTGTRASG